MKRITVNGRVPTVEATIITGISVYESVAIISGAIPTITDLVLRLPKPARLALLGAVGLWMIDHFEVAMRRVT